MRTTALLLAFAAAAFTAAASDTPAYTLHEWGTFTSVSGSDGVLLPGLDREEEALPSFVYSHDGMSEFVRLIKGFTRPLHNVTIKMETPVIYFYTDKPFDAKVRVGFNGGSISQWYPKRSGGETPPSFTPISGAPNDGAIDFAKPYKGSIEWNVNVQPPAVTDSAAVFKQGETLTWIYPRQTDSALVRSADGGTEKFLFYRGVGNFKLPVTFTLPNDRTLQIQNTSKAAIPATLIFNHTKVLGEDRVSYALLKPIAAGESRSMSLPEPTKLENWEHVIYDAMRGALVQAGLFPKEADAMMQTWWNSYFEHPGLRAFWLVPQTITESILPLNVSPAPAAKTRILVGRSELLTPSYEYELTAQFAKGTGNPLKTDRFYLAYEARVNALKNPDLHPLNKSP